MSVRALSSSLLRLSQEVVWEVRKLLQRSFSTRLRVDRVDQCETVVEWKNQAVKVNEKQSWREADEKCCPVSPAAHAFLFPECNFLVRTYCVRLFIYLFIYLFSLGVLFYFLPELLTNGRTNHDWTYRDPFSNNNSGCSMDATKNSIHTAQNVGIVLKRTWDFRAIETD